MESGGGMEVFGEWGDVGAPGPELRVFGPEPEVAPAVEEVRRLRFSPVLVARL